MTWSLEASVTAWRQVKDMDVWHQVVSMTTLHIFYSPFNFQHSAEEFAIKEVEKDNGTSFLGIVV